MEAMDSDEVGWRAFEEALERADSLDEFLPAQCRSGDGRRGVKTVYNVHAVREEGRDDKQQRREEVRISDEAHEHHQEEKEEERWSVFGGGEASPAWTALRALFVARLHPENVLYDPHIAGTNVDALAHVYGVVPVAAAAAVPPPPLPGPSAMLKALESCTCVEQRHKVYPLAVFILVYCLPRWAASRQVARVSLGAAAYSAIRALGLNALDEASFERVVRHIEDTWASDSAIGDAQGVASLRRELIGAHAATQFPM